MFCFWQNLNWDSCVNMLSFSLAWLFALYAVWCIKEKQADGALGNVEKFLLGEDLKCSILVVHVFFSSLFLLSHLWLTGGTWIKSLDSGIAEGGQQLYCSSPLRSHREVCFFSISFFRLLRCAETHLLPWLWSDPCFWAASYLCSMLASGLPLLARAFWQPARFCCNPFSSVFIRLTYGHFRQVQGRNANREKNTELITESLCQLELPWSRKFSLAAFC